MCKKLNRDLLLPIGFGRCLYRKIDTVIYKACNRINQLEKTPSPFRNDAYESMHHYSIIIWATRPLGGTSATSSTIYNLGRTLCNMKK